MTTINTNLFNFINHGLENPLLNTIMPVFTKLGSFKFIILLLIVAFIIAKFKNKEKIKNIILICIVSVLFADLIALILKFIVNEPRPEATLSNVHLLIVENDPRSFPSGHTTTVFAFITSLMLNIKGYIKNYKVICAILIIYGIAIGFSRIYIGVHYPFDVIFGAAIGICGAIAVSNFDDKILKYYYKVIGKIKTKKA